MRFKAIIAMAALLSAASLYAQLPDGFTEVTYIKGNATSASDTANAGYIITDILPNPVTDTLSLDYTPTTIYQQGILCARTKSGSAYVKSWSLLACVGNTKLRFDYNDKNKQSDVNYSAATDTYDSKKRITVTISQNICAINKTGLANEAMTCGTYSSSFTQTGGPILLLAYGSYVNSAYTEISNFSSVQLHMLTIARNNTIIHKLVPALRDEDGVAGLYDVITDKFYPGTGSFTVGDTINQLNAFSISPIPNQLAASRWDLGLGIKPSITISNLIKSVELVPERDYTVTYSGNTTVGIAQAAIKGRGNYAAYSRTIYFPITGFPVCATFFAIGGTAIDPVNCSSIRGQYSGGWPTGWSTAKGTTSRSMNGIEANKTYYIWQNRTMRSPVGGAWSAAQTSAVNIDENCTWSIIDKLKNATMTLYNVMVRQGATIHMYPANESGTALYKNNVAGTFNLEKDASLIISASKTTQDAKQHTLSAKVSGIGAIHMISAADSQPYSQTLVQSITSDLSKFTGDILTYNGGTPVLLEIVNQSSLPADPPPQDISYIVVTNGATLQINNNWTSPTNRIWILGNSGVPTINIPAGRNVTITGPVIGSVGFKKTGLGTLTIVGDQPNFSGDVETVAGEVNFVDELVTAFVPSAIPNQTAESLAALKSGIEPMVTVSNLDTSAELVLDRDYIVSYENNKIIGYATAIVTGIGDYAAYSGKVSFNITGITGFTKYYAAAGTAIDGNGGSSISGDYGPQFPTGWSTTRGSSSRQVNGLTQKNSLYFVWQDRTMKTRPRNFTSESTAIVIVELGYTWSIIDKLKNNTVNINNVMLQPNSTMRVYADNEGGTALYRNTYGGSIDLAKGSTLIFDAAKTAGDAKHHTLSATVTGNGSIIMRTAADSQTYGTMLTQQITGNLTNFRGNISTYNGGTPVTLQLVNATSIPGNPIPTETAYVVVTNGATLQINNNWTSPTNRIWILGNSGVPTINIPTDKTVTIEGDLIGSAGFRKTGAGTLILRGASPKFSGEITVIDGRVLLAGDAQSITQDSRVTLVENGGKYYYSTLYLSPIPPQTATSLEALAAGVKPSLVVSNLETGVELKLDTDYTVSFINNTTIGTATAILTSIGDNAGVKAAGNFIIHSVKEVLANYSLTSDEDWTAFESVTVASGITVDLKGHKLTISGLNGSGTITDSVGNGELHYNVPATSPTGYKATITSVSLTGKLSLIIGGKGPLTLVKFPQTFTGITRIKSGLVKYGCANANINQNNGSPFGKTRAVTIDKDGIFDPAGSWGWTFHKIYLNGGMISNTVSHTSYAFNPELTVSADSIIATTANYKWQGGAVNLQGHKLTVWIKSGVTLQYCPILQNGVLDVINGGTLQPFNYDLDSSKLNLNLNAALNIGITWSIHDYNPLFRQNSNLGSAPLKVYGCFNPISDYFYGPTLQNGSAIDLSSKDKVWSVKSALTSGGNAITRFAKNATINIKLGSRTPPLNSQLISWTAGTRPDRSVSFTNDTYTLRREAYGLYIDAPRSFAHSPVPMQVAKSAEQLAAGFKPPLTISNLVTGVELINGTDYTIDYSANDKLGKGLATIIGLGEYSGITNTVNFGITASIPMPNQFRRMDSLTASATNCIWTGVQMAKDIAIETEMSISNTSQTAYSGVIFNDSKGWYYIGSSGAKLHSRFADSSSNAGAEIENNNDFNYYRLEDGLQIVGSSTNKTAITDFSSTLPDIEITIFRLNSDYMRYNKARAPYPTAQTIKYFNIYKDGVPIRAFIPVYHRRTKKKGLWDTVTGKFYSITTPVGYTDIGYIESTGTQYIDTGYYPAPGAKTGYYPAMEAEIACTPETPTGRNCSGITYADGAGWFAFGVYTTSDTKQLGAWATSGTNGRSDSTCAAIPYDTDFHTYFAASLPSGSGGTQTYVDSTGKTAMANAFKGSTTANISFKIGRFDYNFEDTEMNNEPYYAKQKIRWWNIYDDRIQVRELVPVWNEETNAPGLYDRINDLFYPNLGTGKFNSDYTLPPQGTILLIM